MFDFDWDFKMAILGFSQTQTIKDINKIVKPRGFEKLCTGPFSRLSSEGSRKQRSKLLDFLSISGMQ